jgi:eukaryotic-like serine/threonine-protein kinase
MVRSFSRFRMSSSPQQKTAYRFGLFEVFPESGELWKHGHRLKLQDQPFRLLVALLEQPGELVSREAIRDHLWPGNTFVEFDQSLGTAVTKLRQTLGDDADNPRFIETVPKRGYRFLAPVTVVAAPAAQALPVESESRAAVEAEPVAPEPTGSRRRLLGVITVGLALLIAGPLLYRRLHPAARLRPNDAVVLATIQNNTSEPIFDDTLYQALRVKLNESPFFSVIPERTLRAALAKLNRNAGEQISEDDARAACAELKAQAVISGNVASSAGKGYQIVLTATRCGSGAGFTRESATAATREEVLSSLGTATDALRRKLGEPAESVERFGTPLAQATTSSLAALQAFSVAEAKHNRGSDEELIPQYKLATDLDPNFALAYARLGVLHSNANEQSKSIAEYQKAFDLREHTTERERLVITAHYYSTVQGDLEKSAEVYSLWRQLYPNDVVPPNNLADDYEQLGQIEKSLENAKVAVQLGPNNAFPYVNLVQALQRLGEFGEAKKVYADATARKLDYIGFHMTLFQIAFTEHDEAAMQDQIAWARGNEREGELLNLIAWSKLAAGQVRAARTYFRQAEDVSIKNGLNEFAADIAEDDAQFEVDFGFVSQGRIEIDRAVKLAPEEINVVAFASMILARAGDLDRAEAFVAQADKLAPRYTIYQKMVLPTARGLIHLRKNDPEAAIQAMSVVAPYDLNRPMEMCGVYYRAEALLAAHKNKEAAAEFQRLLDHSSIRPVSPYLVLAHLGIARALHADGDIPGARRQYRTFFDLWKTADSDLPILLRARGEGGHLSAFPKRVGAYAFCSPRQSAFPPCIPGILV